MPTHLNRKDNLSPNAFCTSNKDVSSHDFAQIPDSVKPNPNSLCLIILPFPLFCAEQILHLFFLYSVTRICNACDQVANFSLWLPFPR